MGTAVELTSANFESTVSGDGLVLVDFWAAWCGPCRAFAPVFEKVASAHPDATFGKVDTEAEQAIAAEFGIQSIPTLMIFRDGILLYNQAGALPEHALSDLVDKAKALDMDAVRAEIDAQSTWSSNEISYGKARDCRKLSRCGGLPSVHPSLGFDCRTRQRRNDPKARAHARRRVVVFRVPIVTT